MAWGSSAASAGTKPLSWSAKQSTCSKATSAPRDGTPAGFSRGLSPAASSASPYTVASGLAGAHWQDHHLVSLIILPAHMSAFALSSRQLRKQAARALEADSGPDRTRRGVL